jgi:hypothetical protein
MKRRNRYEVGFIFNFLSYLLHSYHHFILRIKTFTGVIRDNDTNTTENNIVGTVTLYVIKTKAVTAPAKIKKRRKKARNSEILCDTISLPVP